MSNPMSNHTETLDDARAALFAALKGIKDGSMDLATAKMTSELCQTLTNMSKVEADYLKQSGQGESRFLSGGIVQEALPNGIVGIKRHLLRD